jgi:hypothetical protein
MRKILLSILLVLGICMISFAMSRTNSTMAFFGGMLLGLWHGFAIK